MNTQRGAGKTLLIADDRPDNLNVLIGFLEAYGYNILVARNAEEVFNRLEHLLPDIILLDIMMPGIDGFEACRRLKAHEAYQDIPVIFMSAPADTTEPNTEWQGPPGCPGGAPNLHVHGPKAVVTVRD